MLFYNVLVELRFDQGLILAILLGTISLVNMYLLRKEFLFSHLLNSIVCGVLLSLLSLSFVRGGFSGMGYYERFGWPIQYQGVWRSMENLTPSTFDFNFLKFFGNAFLFGSFVYNIVLLTAKRTHKRMIFVALFAIIVFLISMWFCFSNWKYENSTKIVESLSFVIKFFKKEI